MYQTTIKCNSNITTLVYQILHTIYFDLIHSVIITNQITKSEITVISKCKIDNDIFVSLSNYGHITIEASTSDDIDTFGNDSDYARQEN